MQELCKTLPTNFIVSLFLSLRDLCQSWYEMMIAKLLYTDPTVKTFDLHANTMVIKYFYYSTKYSHLLYYCDFAYIRKILLFDWLLITGFSEELKISCRQKFGKYFDRS